VWRDDVARRSVGAGAAGGWLECWAPCASSLAIAVSAWPGLGDYECDQTTYYDCGFAWYSLMIGERHDRDDGWHDMIRHAAFRL